MRILFVSPYVPSRVRVRPYYWIRHLCDAGHDVHLYTLAGDDDRLALDAMRHLCRRVIAEPLPRWRPLLNAAAALITGDSLQYAWSRQPALSRAIRHGVSTGTFDVAHIEHLRGACFAADTTPLPVVYDAVDSISLLFAQTRSRGPRPIDRWTAALDLRRTRAFEAGVCRRFARVLVTSRADASAFAALTQEATPDCPTVLPNPVDLEYFAARSGPPDPATVLFSGKMSYHANIAAACRLVRQVMPHVWRVRPDTRVLIAGQAPDRTVQALAADPRVTVTGRVEDLRPLFARATTAVCPLVYGVGIQNKILEALAAGVPVVATTAATEALAVTPGVDVAVADAPAACAAEVLRLIESPALQQDRARRGRAYVERHHGLAAIGARLEEIYRQCAERP